METVTFQPQPTFLNETSKLTVRKAKLTLRAYDHPLRKQILKLIEGEGKITVTEIYVALRLEQSVASQHLAILRKAGLVSTERDRKYIYYKVNALRTSAMIELCRQINELIETAA